MQRACTTGSCFAPRQWPWTSRIAGSLPGRLGHIGVGRHPDVRAGLEDELLDAVAVAFEASPSIRASSGQGSVGKSAPSLEQPTAERICFRVRQASTVGGGVSLARSAAAWARMNSRYSLGDGESAAATGVAAHSARASAVNSRRAGHCRPIVWYARRMGRSSARLRLVVSPTSLPVCRAGGSRSTPWLLAASERLGYDAPVEFSNIRATSPQPGDRLMKPLTALLAIIFVGFPVALRARTGSTTCVTSSRSSPGGATRAMVLSSTRPSSGSTRRPRSNAAAQGARRSSPATSGESLLIDAVTGDESSACHPEGDPFRPRRSRLKAWVDQGAEIPGGRAPRPTHAGTGRSLSPSGRPYSVAQNAEWSRNPVDAFLAAEHQRRGLTPRPEADPSTLLRRVYVDLIGLAPTPEERRAFLNDPDPDALRTRRRPPAGRPALRRALGPALDGRLAL